MLIKSYQESWINEFNQIKEVLLQSLVDLSIRIEHIGSTSIPDLAAKSIIDIDIVYDKKVNFEAIKNRLEGSGYYHNGDQGIKDREVFKRKASTEKHLVLDVITQHLYVCPIHSEELQRHLLFRDFLTKHEKERREYEAIKYRIAQEANQDRKKYAQLKEVQGQQFINSIIERAKKNRNQ